MKEKPDSLTHTAAPLWLTPCAGGVLIDLHVQPGARHEGLAGEHDGRLKLALRSPPLEGRANAALLEWLSTQLNVPLAALSLVRGAGARIKRVKVTGVDASAVQTRLAMAKKKEQP